MKSATQSSHRRRRREKSLTLSFPAPAQNSSKPSREFDLNLRNRQQTRPVDLKLLRDIIVRFLNELPAQHFDLDVQLIGENEMARLNEKHVQHKGSTDVITIDYGDRETNGLTGELFICVDEALIQARHFRTTWQSEIVRYIIHGILHLCGYSDLNPGARRKMKREENRRLRQLSREFDLSKLRRKPRVTA